VIAVDGGALPSGQQPFDRDRRNRILARLLPEADAVLGTERLCRVCADVTAVSGAGIMLLSDDLPRGSLCTTDPVSARIEELQYTLGEGPCVDAYRQGRPVLEPDLAEPALPRWVAFAAAAIGLGVRAMFGFPMQVGSVRLGALNLYSDRRGSLSEDQHADAMVMADIAAEAVLVMQSDAPPGTIGAELQAGADFRYVVHQASGMVSAQLEVPLGRALILLRAYAFSHDRRLTSVAEDVVGRRLRFDDRGDDAASGR
jgi:hypothetical protein